MANLLLITVDTESQERIRGNNHKFVFPELSKSGNSPRAIELMDEPGIVDMGITERVDFPELGSIVCRYDEMAIGSNRQIFEPSAVWESVDIAQMGWWTACESKCGKKESSRV